MNASHRRGACPGLSAPMPTGDGLLVRLMPAQPIPLDAFIAFCAAAGRHGNGTVEITARGRGEGEGARARAGGGGVGSVPPFARPPPFASAVAALGISAIEDVPVI